MFSLIGGTKEGVVHKEGGKRRRFALIHGWREESGKEGRKVMKKRKKERRKKKKEEEKERKKERKKRH